jgi:phosphoribosylformylglycinamidine cyclo-ligase
LTNLTYKQAGVDIKRAGIFKARIKSVVRSSFRSEVLRDIGGFGSFFKFAKDNFRQPVLVSSADGVGTKLRIAILANKHDTVGIDAVAMNVNDILCTGAEPLFFLDYIAYSKLKEKTLVDIVKGLNRGCIQSGCSLIGGETAQMPGMYRDGDYDIAGFCVGVAERKKIIDGSALRAGDLVIGLEASGLHSNGYSLVRKVFSENELKKLSGELLKPTRIYVKPVLKLLRTTPDTRHPTIRGIANITGGAFYDKIARILPQHLSVQIQKGSWMVPKIFQVIQAKGRIADKEIYHTLNMGIGMVLVVDPQAAKAIVAGLSGMRLKSWVIGKVSKGNKSVAIV